MPSPFLAVRANSGGTAQVYSYQGATPTAVGTAAGTTQSTVRIHSNLVVAANGLIGYMAYDGFRVSRDDGYTWTLVHAVSVTSTAPTHGPVAVNTSDGIKYVIIFMNAAAGNSLFAAVSDDLINWTNYNFGVSIFAFWPVVWRDRIVTWSANTTNQLFIFDPAAASHSVVNVNDRSIRCITIWNDQIWATGVSSAGSLTVAGIINGVPTYDVVFGTGGFTQGVNVGNQPACSFVDPSTGNLVVLASSASAWYALEVTSVSSLTERTSTMLTGGSLATYNVVSTIKGVVIDQIDSVGSSPVINIYITNGITSGSLVAVFRYNGVGSLLGDSGGAPNASGGTVNDSFPNQNIDSLRNWTPRKLDSIETEGTPYAQSTAEGTAIVNGIRVQFQAVVPRTIPLVTIGGSPATYNLATTPIPSTPIKPGSVAIHGTISGTVEVALDDGVGAFPVSTLLPSGGTINYATGAITGTTATLDASTDVRAYWAGGTASVQFFRTLATDSYPADVITNTVNPAPLSNPTQGTISGDTNVNVPADGTTCQVDIDMTGFSSGDRVSIEPYVF